MSEIHALPTRPAAGGETPAVPALQAPVSILWGVGDERAKQLARLDILTVEDLLLHKPRRYEDRRRFRPIRDLTQDEAATVRGKIVAAGIKRFYKGTRSLFECVLEDGTARLHCRWWQAHGDKEVFRFWFDLVLPGSKMGTAPLRRGGKNGGRGLAKK